MPNDQTPMTNEEGERSRLNQVEQHPVEQYNKKFDLEERTALFAEEIIRFARAIKLDPISTPLIKQLVRSATSVGANYCEADAAGSRKEFRYRISLCQRESKETQYWLRLIGNACPDHLAPARIHWKEAMELTKIFATIYRKTPAEQN